ncbi:HAD-like protein [Aaosphaeria arxii CBS 175.79]|uniref:HAD-like protein n=1 Tax=Aaosphaeria arxii CBS 175.79 TaxID=1450172 RepID=A0A6A5XXM4_9PLEO|nr:HAD-like protein [Aaosphaeria arxii CBS 175.79]KAF2017481.1 HAD-like protein [Aaosphaeria arxii CBS 175.79]
MFLPRVFKPFPGLWNGVGTVHMPELYSFCEFGTRVLKVEACEKEVDIQRSLPHATTVQLYMRPASAPTRYTTYFRMEPLNQTAIFFDLMGTCCDWLISLKPVLLSCPAHTSLEPRWPKLQSLAISWREGFFSEIHARFEKGLPAEDIDITHRRVLDRLLEALHIGLDDWDEDVRRRLVQQWHRQQAWPDVIPALQKLRQRGDVFLVVLANGTTRLQLDIAQSSNIPFHMLMSSELLGLTKPDLDIYRKAMDLAKLAPKNCTMLASHLYDLEAAKKVGMRTVYVHRSTEDVGIEIDIEGEQGYVDHYFDGRYESEGAGVPTRDIGFLEVVDSLYD